MWKQQERSIAYETGGEKREFFYCNTSMKCPTNTVIRNSKLICFFNSGKQICSEICLYTVSRQLYFWSRIFQYGLFCSVIP